MLRLFPRNTNGTATGLVVCLLLSVSMSAQAVLLTDFEALSSGNLDGQDGWETTLHSTGTDIQVTPGAGPNGSQAALFTQSGSGVGADASILRGANFDLPQFGSGTGFFQFDLRVPYWGTDVALGVDVNNNGLIRENEAGEYGIGITTDDRTDSLTFHAADGGSTSVNYDTSGFSSSWITFMIAMDFEANSGAGAASVFMGDAQAASSLTAVAGLQNISMGLNGLASDAQNASLWNGMALHFEGATGGIDNIEADSVSVPVPGTALLLVGAMLMMGRGRGSVV